MEHTKKLKEEIATSSVLETLIQAYQEQAVEHINLARNSVLASRDFAAELAKIFFDVKTSYLNRLKEQSKNTLNKIQKVYSNGRDAIVLLSANNKLYGDIIPRVSNLFCETAKNSDADIFIIGKQGRAYYEQRNVGKNFEFFEIPDTKISIENLKSIISYLILYDTVTVFYGRFTNIFSQEPVKVNLSGSIPESTQTPKSQQDFLFEPSIEDVLRFFETQIFLILFNQSTHEAQLGRFASRIKAMEIAQTNVHTQMKELLKRKKRLENIEINKKQLGLLAGRSLWRVEGQM